MHTVIQIAAPHIQLQKIHLSQDNNIDMGSETDLLHFMLNSTYSYNIYYINYFKQNPPCLHLVWLVY